MDKIKHILEKHYKRNLVLCEKNEPERRYLQNKYIHSYHTLECGQAIAPADIAADTLATVLLLHDIGRFYEHLHLPNFKHADYGVRILQDEGLDNMTILLPIKYHETEDWQAALTTDSDYQQLPSTTQNQIKLLCQTLIEADIIDNMQILTQHNTEPTTMTLTPAILNCLLMEQLADDKDIHNCADAIVYILCGLAAIHSESGRRYLKDNHIVQNLIKQLLAFAADDAVFQNNIERIRNKINETYHFQI